MSLKASHSFFPLTWQLRSLYLKIKRQYRSFRFSNFYTISQCLICSINLHPQTTRVGSPVMNWGLPAHVTRAHYFGADNPQAIDLKKRKRKSVVWSLTFVQTFIKLLLSIGRKRQHSLTAGGRGLKTPAFLVHDDQGRNKSVESSFCTQLTFSRVGTSGQTAQLPDNIFTLFHIFEDLDVFITPKRTKRTG